MRKVTEAITRAFNQNQPLKVGNTVTDGQAIYLHGNKIAEKRDGNLWITNAGWRTNTTKERLNALHGVSISQKAFNWYLNGKAWSGEWIKVA